MLRISRLRQVFINNVTKYAILLVYFITLKIVLVTILVYTINAYNFVVKMKIIFIECGTTFIPLFDLVTEPTRVNA